MEINKEVLDTLLSSGKGKEIANTLMNLDPKTKEKLMNMAQKLDQNKVNSMINDPNMLKSALKNDELMEKLKNMLKG